MSRVIWELAFACGIGLVTCCATACCCTASVWLAAFLGLTWLLALLFAATIASFLLSALLTDDSSYFNSSIKRFLTWLLQYANAYFGEISVNVSTSKKTFSVPLALTSVDKLTTEDDERVCGELRKLAKALHSKIVLPWYLRISPDGHSNQQILAVLEETLLSAWHQLNKSGGLSSLVNDALSLLASHTHRSAVHGLPINEEKSEEEERILCCQLSRLSQLLLLTHLPHSLLPCQSLIFLLRDLLTFNLMLPLYLRLSDPLTLILDLYDNLGTYHKDLCLHKDFICMSSSDKSKQYYNFETELPLISIPGNENVVTTPGSSIQSSTMTTGDKNLLFKTSVCVSNASPQVSVTAAKPYASDAVGTRVKTYKQKNNFAQKIKWRTNPFSPSVVEGIKEEDLSRFQMKIAPLSVNRMVYRNSLRIRGLITPYSRSDPNSPIDECDVVDCSTLNIKSAQLCRSKSDGSLLASSDTSLCHMCASVKCSCDFSVTNASDANIIARNDVAFMNNSKKRMLVKMNSFDNNDALTDISASPEKDIKSANIFESAAKTSCNLDSLQEIHPEKSRALFGNNIMETLICGEKPHCLLHSAFSPANFPQSSKSFTVRFPPDASLQTASSFIPKTVNSECLFSTSCCECKESHYMESDNLESSSFSETQSGIKVVPHMDGAFGSEIICTLSSVTPSTVVSSCEATSTAVSSLKTLSASVLSSKTVSTILSPSVTQSRAVPFFETPFTTVPLCETPSSAGLQTSKSCHNLACSTTNSCFLPVSEGRLYESHSADDLSKVVESCEEEQVLASSSISVPVIENETQRESEAEDLSPIYEECDTLESSIAKLRSLLSERDSQHSLGSLSSMGSSDSEPRSAHSDPGGSRYTLHDALRFSFLSTNRYASTATIKRAAILRSNGRYKLESKEQSKAACNVGKSFDERTSVFETDCENPRCQDEGFVEEIADLLEADEVPVDGRLFLRSSVFSTRVMKDTNGFLFTLYSIQYEALYIDEHYCKIGSSVPLETSKNAKVHLSNIVSESSKQKKLCADNVVEEISPLHAISAAQESRLVLRTRCVERRYREFVALHNSLSSHPLLRHSVRNVVSPNKWRHLPNSKLNESTVSARKAFLQDYLQALLRKPEINSSMIMRDFLGYGVADSDSTAMLLCTKKSPDPGLFRLDRLLGRTVSGVFQSLRTTHPIAESDIVDAKDVFTESSGVSLGSDATTLTSMDSHAIEGSSLGQETKMHSISEVSLVKGLDSLSSHLSGTDSVLSSSKSLMNRGDASSFLCSNALSEQLQFSVASTDQVKTQESSHRDSEVGAHELDCQLLIAVTAEIRKYFQPCAIEESLQLELQKSAGKPSTFNKNFRSSAYSGQYSGRTPNDERKGSLRSMSPSSKESWQTKLGRSLSPGPNLDFPSNKKLRLGGGVRPFDVQIKSHKKAEILSSKSTDSSPESLHRESSLLDFIDSSLENVTVRMQSMSNLTCASVEQLGKECSEIINKDNVVKEKSSQTLNLAASPSKPLSSYPSFSDFFLKKSSSSKELHVLESAALKISKLDEDEDAADDTVPVTQLVLTSASLTPDTEESLGEDVCDGSIEPSFKDYRTLLPCHSCSGSVCPPVTLPSRESSSASSCGCICYCESEAVEQCTCHKMNCPLHSPFADSFISVCLSLIESNNFYQLREKAPEYITKRELIENAMSKRAVSESALHILSCLIVPSLEEYASCVVDELCSSENIVQYLKCMLSLLTDDDCDTELHSALEKRLSPLSDTAALAKAESDQTENSGQKCKVGDHGLKFPGENHGDISQTCSTSSDRLKKLLLNLMPAGLLWSGAGDVLVRELVRLFGQPNFCRSLALHLIHLLCSRLLPQSS